MGFKEALAFKCRFSGIGLPDQWYGQHQFLSDALEKNAVALEVPLNDIIAR
jgi:hypothetical protein